MTVRKVLKLDSRLITKTKQVSFPLNIETIKEIDDMKYTLLLSTPNSASLAANQIGINKQIIVYGINDPIVMINPTIDLYSKEKTYGQERCLSVPSFDGIVPRYSQIHVSGYDEFGVLHEKIENNLCARHIQHAIDHLNGITVFDRIKNKTLL